MPTPMFEQLAEMLFRALTGDADLSQLEFMMLRYKELYAEDYRRLMANPTAKRFWTAMEDAIRYSKPLDKQGQPVTTGSGPLLAELTVAVRDALLDETDKEGTPPLLRVKRGLDALGGTCEYCIFDAIHDGVIEGIAIAEKEEDWN
jgi:hypothetical protein